MESRGEAVASGSSAVRPIYHERQSLELCLLHALNNLFQKMVFTKSDLNSACNSLAPDSPWLNPHRSWIGLGNYDVNVLSAALSTQDVVAKWWDRRIGIDALQLAAVVGFILNVPSQPKLGPFTIPIPKRGHWITVREIDGTWYNLDSKLKVPQLLGDEEGLRAFLTVISDAGHQIFVIVPNDVEISQAWLKPQHRPKSST